MLIGVSRQAIADPIILAPSGTTLTTGQVRAEAALSPGNDHGNYLWLSTGFMQFEADLIRIETPGSATQNRIGAQWNFLPQTAFTPAVAFGVQDVATQSQEEMGAYAVMTKALPLNGGLSILKEASGTIGVGAGQIAGLFFGLETKLPFNFFAQGEYDSHEFNAAVGWQPISIFRVKAYTIRSDVYFGAELLPISF